jgi:hypothetical protein
MSPSECDLAHTSRTADAVPLPDRPGTTTSATLPCELSGPTRPASRSLNFAVAVVVARCYRSPGRPSEVEIFTHKATRGTTITRPDGILENDYRIGDPRDDRRRGTPGNDQEQKPHFDGEEGSVGCDSDSTGPKIRSGQRLSAARRDRPRYSERLSPSSHDRRVAGCL